MSDRQKALRLERVRDLYRRRTRQGAFEAGFLRLDALTEEAAEMVTSDGGKGVEDIINAIDAPIIEEQEKAIAEAARKRLKRRHPQTVEVFNLALKHQNERGESICELMRIIACGKLPGSAIGAT